MPVQPPERPGCPKAPGGGRPLPDPAAVRLCLVPDPAPPYDGEVSAGEAHLGETRREEAARRELRSGEPRSAKPGGEEARGPRRPAAAGAPPGWQSRFAQVLAETLAGSRPSHQIVPWTTEQARDHIQRLGPRLASPQRPRVRRVVTSRPAPDVMEMTVVVGFGPRVKALAVRLERAGTCTAGDRAPRWLCTAVEAA